MGHGLAQEQRVMLTGHTTHMSNTVHDYTCTCVYVCITNSSWNTYMYVHVVRLVRGLWWLAAIDDIINSTTAHLGYSSIWEEQRQVIRAFMNGKDVL